MYPSFSVFSSYVSLSLFLSHLSGIGSSHPTARLSTRRIKLASCFSKFGIFRTNRKHCSVRPFGENFPAREKFPKNLPPLHRYMNVGASALVCECALAAGDVLFLHRLNCNRKHLFRPFSCRLLFACSNLNSPPQHLFSFLQLCQNGRPPVCTRCVAQAHNTGFHTLSQDRGTLVGQKW